MTNPPDEAESYFRRKFLRLCTLIAGSSTTTFSAATNARLENMKNTSQDIDSVLQITQLRSDISNASGASGKGSDIVGFREAGSEAKPRTIQDKLREQPSIEDYNGPAETAFSTAASAVKAQGGGTFRAGKSAYTTSGPLKITGDFGAGLVYEGRRSTITPSDSNTSAYLIGNEKGNVAANYFNKYTLRDISASGLAKSGNSAGLLQQAAADVNIDGGQLKKFAIGLYLHGALSSDYSRITISENGTGIKAQSFNGKESGLNSFSCNANSFYAVRCYHNNIAVNYRDNASGAVTWFSCNFEDNNQSGTPNDGTKIVELGNAGHHNFIGCHFEANQGQYGIHYTGADNGKSLVMLGCEVIDNVGTNLHVARGRLTSIGSRITNGKSVYDIDIGPGARATLIDTEGALSGDASCVVALRDGRLGFGIQPINNSPLVEATPQALNSAGNTATQWRNDTVRHTVLSTAGNRIAYTQYGASTDVLHHVDIAFGHRFDANNAVVAYIGRSGSPSIEPGVNNSISCGSGNLRWSVVYAGTSSITTSDARLKTPVRTLSASETAAAKQLSAEIGVFQFLAAVKEKGPSARLHVGMTVQRAIEIMQGQGLNPYAYGFICHDTSKHGNRTQQGGKDNAGTAPCPAFDEYGFRVDELLLFIAAGIEARLKKLEEA